MADMSPAPEKFEGLLAQLDKIVSEMEHTELPLEQLLSHYEEGMRLVKACGERLADAEQKVEILSKTSLSEPSQSSTLETEEEADLF